jgi:hypothetical protein
MLAKVINCLKKEKEEESGRRKKERKKAGETKNSFDANTTMRLP